MWTAGADSTKPVFLAVLDVTPNGDRYGRLVTTLPVPGIGNSLHHTERVMASDGFHIANVLASGQSFVFDLNTPTAPRIAKQFGELAGY